MSYKVTGASEAVVYTPPAHYDMRATKLHAADEVGGEITLGLSYFLPGGGANRGAAPIELLYYVLDGEMTVWTDDGKAHVLHGGDSIHFGAGQEREVKNTGYATAKMLVISGAKK